MKGHNSSWTIPATIAIVFGPLLGAQVLVASADGTETVTVVHVTDSDGGCHPSTLLGSATGTRSRTTDTPTAGCRAARIARSR